jgi:hypothetical protein
MVRSVTLLRRGSKRNLCGEDRVTKNGKVPVTEYLRIIDAEFDI